MRKLIAVKCGMITSPSINMNCLPFNLELEEDNRRDEEEDEEAEEDEGSDYQIDVVLGLVEDLSEEESQRLQRLAPGLERFRKRSLGYISGYIVYQMMDGVSCKSCHSALFDSELDPLDSEAAKLIQQKNTGGLVVPSGSVSQIIMVAEQVEI